MDALGSQSAVAHHGRARLHQALYHGDPFGPAFEFDGGGAGQLQRLGRAAEHLDRLQLRQRKRDSGDHLRPLHRLAGQFGMVKHLFPGNGQRCPNAPKQFMLRKSPAGATPA